MAFFDLGLTDLLGGAVSAFGAKKQNDAGQAIAREQMQFQKESLQNAYQWRVEDLKKAGLNPMLAYGQSVSGASGASYNPVNVGESAVSGAASAASAQQARRMTDANVENTRAMTAKNLAEADRAKTEAENLRKWGPHGLGRLGASLESAITRIFGLDQSGKGAARTADAIRGSGGAPVLVEPAPRLGVDPHRGGPDPKGWEEFLRNQRRSNVSDGAAYKWLMREWRKRAESTAGPIRRWWNRNFGGR